MTKYMITELDPRVKAWYDHVQLLPRDKFGRFIAGNACNGNGFLYVIGNTKQGWGIQPWLPQDLMEFANAGSGSSGGRPVGIRILGFDSVEQAADRIADIFDSPESIAEFLNASACDYQTVPLKQKASKVPMALEEFWKKYDKEMAQALSKKYGTAVVRSALETSTLAEFELNFELDLLKSEIDARKVLVSH